MKKISLVLFAGMCFLLSAQFCNAQLSVFGYYDFDDVVGWKVGANNSGCQRARAAEEDYYRRGGKQIGLQRFSGLQQQCSDNQYGCYALVRGFNTNPATNVKRAVYSFISGGADTKEEAERRATDGALYNVPGADRGTISVLTSGCIAKPSSPSQPANPSAKWSGWVTGGDCFRKVSYRYMSRELVDLNYQFHYYFEARNDYPETIFFILSLKDASGRERFGTRHTIAPGQTIKFAEKMDKNYIKMFAIEKVRFKSDTGDYAACDDERTSSRNATDPSKPAPAKDTTDPKQVDVSLPTAPANNAAAIKQKIVENLRTNIRPFRFEQRTTIGIPNVIAISNISVDLNENGIAVRYTLRKEGGIYLGTTGSRPGWNGYESGWSEWQLVETIPFDRLFSTLQVDTDHRNAFLLKNSTNRVVNAFGKEEVIGQTTGGAWDRGSPGQVYGQMALIYYDAGPGGQNFNDLKALAQQLTGGASPSSAIPLAGQTSATTANTTQSKNTTISVPYSADPYGDGVKKYNSGEYEQAAEYFKQAVARYSDSYFAYWYLGMAYYNLQRYDQAIEALKQAIALNPKLATSHGGLGNALERAKRYDEAIAAHNRAIQLDPANYIYYVNLGVAQLNKGSRDDAVRAFQRAVQLKPDYDLAHYLLGLTYLGLNDKAAAQKEYDTLVSLGATDFAKKLKDLIK
ncbi:MAG: tetratricopeptide repeat protein [Pyrinomonadaceae bacterium]